MNLPVLLLCGILGAGGGASHMAPQQLIAGETIDLALPASIDDPNSKGLIEVKLKIENAVSGTSIIITNNLNSKILGVITPFGFEGRSTVESFSLPLRALEGEGPLNLSFALKTREPSRDQKISIISVERK